MLGLIAPESLKRPEWRAAVEVQEKARAVAQKGGTLRPSGRKRAAAAVTFAEISALSREYGADLSTEEFKEALRDWHVIKRARPNGS